MRKKILPLVFSVAIDATGSIRSIDQIITDEMSSADVITIKERNEDEENDYMTPSFLVTSALDRVNEFAKINRIF